MAPIILLPIFTLLTTALAANHDITVGPSLQYTPKITTAAVGDTLTFHFDPAEHDIAESEFSKPCDYKSGGFYSGRGTAESELFVVTVNSTDPIYFYCSVPGHCQGGMVGAVNPPTSGDTVAAYQAAAAKTSDSTVPPSVAGGVINPSSVSSAVSASSTAAKSASASSASAASASASSAAISSAMSSAMSSASGTMTSAMGSVASTAASAAKSSGAAVAFGESVGAVAIFGAVVGLMV